MLQIHHKILRPEAGTFAHSSRLSCLKMCKRKCRYIFILFGKITYDGNSAYQQSFYPKHRFFHKYYVGIVAYIA